MPTATDLVTDLPADFEVFGQAVATSMADLLGGTTGQILSKTSNTDMDFTWTTPQVGDITGVTAGTGISGGGTSGTVTVTNSMATAIDAKGDLIAGTGADAFTRLAVGTNNYVLTADSAEATGLKWAAAAGGGKVLQVVQSTYSTTTTSTSTSFVDVGISVSITPTSATSKVLIIVSNCAYAETSASASEIAIQLLKGASVVSTISPALFRAGIGIAATINMTYLDSPATTSATTYKIQCKNITAGGTFYYQYNNSMGTITAMEIGA